MIRPTQTQFRDSIIAGLEEHGYKFALMVVTEWARGRPGGKSLPDFTAAPELLVALEHINTFLDSLPSGWMGKTSGDIGALNEFYLVSSAISADIAKEG